MDEVLARKKEIYVNLLKELQLYPKDWKNYLRMDETTYLELLAMVTPHIVKKDKAKAVRESYVQYFNNEGAVVWQD